MAKIPKEILVAIVSAILSAVATFYVPKILSSNGVSLEFAPVYKEKFINVPNLLDGRVEILVDGRPQKNLSVTDVLLFNRSHKDLKNIPLTFEFYNDDKSGLPEILGKQLTKPDTFPVDSIREVPQKGNQYIRYELTSLPIADGYNTDFVASFVFLGEKPPQVRVQSDYADGKVIEIYKYDKNRRERRQIFTVVATLFPALLAFIGWLIWDSKKINARFLARLGDSAEKLEGYPLEKGQLRQIAIDSYKNVRIKR